MNSEWNTEAPVQVGQGRGRLAAEARRRLAATAALDTPRWRYPIAALWLFGCAAVVVTALGMPTGFGGLFDAVAGAALHTMAFALASVLAAALLALAGFPWPRVVSGSILYVVGLSYAILCFAGFGWAGALAYAVIYTALALLSGLAAAGVAHSLRARRQAWGRSAAVAVCFGAALLAAWALGAGDRTDAGADGAAAGPAERRADGDLLPDPSLPGGFDYTYFTYGSGTDRHRDEYGADAALLSQPADASLLLGGWPWQRGKFWGFGPERLPLNGRVWMPQGDGPFPLVLIVHGNHLMEHFSDNGYAYLGKLLASRGFAAVSVDENFFNYSVWSGIPQPDMLARAWLLLRHIGQIAQFAAAPGNPFSGRVDLRSIALIGHSRGGQAAAMAADRGRWFAPDSGRAAGLPDEAGYTIRAVAALAPTDTAEDGQLSELRDVSYLTLHGDKDADLVHFYGDRQYARVSFTPGADGFKASLYIADANHSRFNTAWGPYDDSFPERLFVRPPGMMSASVQRHITQVYIASFLEAALHGDRQYEELLRDYRPALASGLLPDGEYVSQYWNGETTLITGFEGDDPAAPSSGVAAVAGRDVSVELAPAEDRQGRDKGNRVAEIDWYGESSYTLQFGSAVWNGITAGDELVFALADLPSERADAGGAAEASATEAFEAAGPAAKSDGGQTELELEVALTDRSGRRAVLSVPMLIRDADEAGTDSFTWLPGMGDVIEEGKYAESYEPVLQTMALPLADFLDEEPLLDVAEIVSVTFYFPQEPGSVMLDDVAVQPGEE